MTKYIIFLLLLAPVVMADSTQVVIQVNPENAGETAILDSTLFTIYYLGDSVYYEKRTEDCSPGRADSHR